MYRLMQNSSASVQTVPNAPVAKGRGRPRKFDWEAALAEATRLFWSKGYDATSIADLTAAMGIGSPSLYAAFGSKEALYAEALRHYAQTYEAVVWGRFADAPTAREAVGGFLKDSAEALAGGVDGMPCGCMVTLSSAGGEDHPELGDLVRDARGATLTRLHARIRQAIADGEIPSGLEARALARFVQAVQNGMSILARDGASRADLTAVAEVSMSGWDAFVSGPRP
jgi:AcrR family transcriptional regulator